MNKENLASSNPASTRMFFGAIIILIGVVFMLDQFNFVAVGSLLQYIPSVFIALVVWNLIQNKFRNWVSSAVSILVLSFIQLSILDSFNMSALFRFWPVLLIVGGAAILIQQRRGKSDDSSKSLQYLADSFDVLCLFSGTERRLTTQSFKGGDVTAAFGGADINLTDVQVEDKPAVINVIAFCGGVSFKASPDTIIVNRTVAIFGGSSDERKQRKQLPDESADIVIKGFLMFGGMGIEEK